MNSCIIVVVCGGIDCKLENFCSCKYSEKVIINNLATTKCNNRRAIISECLNRAGKELEFGND